MTQEKAAELLQKYLDGKADQAETEMVERWYGSLPEQPLLPQEYKMIIAQEMLAYVNRTIDEKARKGLRLWHNQWLKVAAILVVLFSAGLLIFTVSRQSDSLETTGELVVATQANQRRVLTLPDGSTIILQPSSKISYPSHFSSDKRNVKFLNGEAFFEVVHEENRSFSVQLSSGIRVKVLGTSFNIRDLAPEKEITVRVATGKVAVQYQDSLISELVKGQELAFHKASGHFILNEAVQDKVVKISFEGASLAEVVRKLEYVYSIRIKVTDSKLLKLSTSAEFNSGQKPAEILDILSRLHRIRFSESRDHKTFYIYK